MSVAVNFNTRQWKFTFERAENLSFSKTTCLQESNFNIGSITSRCSGTEHEWTAEIDKRTAEIEPTILDNSNEKLGPPLPPISMMGKWARFGFCRDSSLIRGEGGGSNFSFYSVQDCNLGQSK